MIMKGLLYSIMAPCSHMLKPIRLGSIAYPTTSSNDFVLSILWPPFIWDNRLLLWERLLCIWTADVWLWLLSLSTIRVLLLESPCSMYQLWNGIMLTMMYLCVSDARWYLCWCKCQRGCSQGKERGCGHPKCGLWWGFTHQPKKTSGQDSFAHSLSAADDGVTIAAVVAAMMGNGRNFEVVGHLEDHCQ